MSIRNLLAKFSALGIAAVVGFSACSDLAAPVETTAISDIAWQDQVLQDETPAILADLDIEGAYSQALIEDVSAKPTGGRGSGGVNKIIKFLENIDEDFEYTGRRWLVKVAKVNPDEITTIVFGTDDVGYTTITVPAGAVDEKVHFKIIMKLRGNRDLFLFPHLVFNKPVTVDYSLKGLNSATIERIAKLRLFYHNREAGGWELIPSTCDGDYVHATLAHFSRYGVGSDE
jgi:hypothetical protein